MIIANFKLQSNSNHYHHRRSPCCHAGMDSSTGEPTVTWRLRGFVKIGRLIQNVLLTYMHFTATFLHVKKKQ